MGCRTAELYHDVSLARATSRWLRLQIISVFQFVGVGTVENEIRPLEHAFGVKRLKIQTIQNFSPSHSGVAIGCNPALRKQTKLRSWLPDVSWKLEKIVKRFSLVIVEGFKMKPAFFGQRVSGFITWLVQHCTTCPSHAHG